MRTLRKYTGIRAKIHVFASVFIILFSGATPQLSKAFAQDSSDGIKVLHAPKIPIAVEGEFLIQFTSDKSLKNMTKGTKPAWVKSLGAAYTLDNSLAHRNIARIKLANPAASGQWENLASLISADPDIVSVEPNYVVHALGQTINDPLAQSLWHLDNISAQKAWNATPKSNGDDIIVAVIDTGIQFDHEDLRGHIWKNSKEIPGNYKDDDGNGYVDDIVGWNFYDNNKYSYSYLNPAPVVGQDPETGRFICTAHPTLKGFEVHGTHVAGIIAAVRNNHLGVAGIADRIKIMPLKALGGPCGNGDDMSILSAVEYAINNGARIINMSLGGYGSSKLEQQLFQKYSDQGVLIIAAAGNEGNDNDGNDRSYPASYPAAGIISVAASTSGNQLTDFSNYGTNNVDLAAPGSKIMSSIPAGQGEYGISDYMALDGTSMAAPIVSGAAAILLAQNPKLTNHQLKKLLLQSVDKFPHLAKQVASGGRLNLYNALSQRISVASKPERKPDFEQSHTQDHNIGGIRIFDTRQNQQKW